ncbi:MAG: Rpn family recombination-promoting nuclease/putative transposase, partial [Lachnospiraceae bacterium]|nr:Rpn family recombination-promoting nuclease/putative transposase [Lachnospiraceae bacterium]
METKSYKELDLTSNFMFCKIMYSNPDVCRQLLEMILKKKVSRIEYSAAEKAIEITADARGIRMDVYLEDETDTVYDIEMQTTVSRKLPKRTRYYQGMIDLNLIERGVDYDKLRKSYVIFICLEDPFDRKSSIYTFENRSVEYPDLAMGDDAFKVFLNASGDKSGIPEELAEFLNYLSGESPKDMFTKRLDDLLRQAREHKKWEVEYMTLEMQYREK